MTISHCRCNYQPPFTIGSIRRSCTSNYVHLTLLQPETHFCKNVVFDHVGKWSFEDGKCKKTLLNVRTCLLDWFDRLASLNNCRRTQGSIQIHSNVLQTNLEKNLTIRES